MDPGDLIVVNDLFTGAGGWITQVFIVVFISLLVDFFQKRVLNRLASKFESTRNLWDDALITALRTPLSLLPRLYNQIPQSPQSLLNLKRKDLNGNIYSKHAQYSC